MLIKFVQKRPLKTFLDVKRFWKFSGCKNWKNKSISAWVPLWKHDFFVFLICLFDHIDLLFTQNVALFLKSKLFANFLPLFSWTSVVTMVTDSNERNGLSWQRIVFVSWMVKMGKKEETQHVSTTHNGKKLIVWIIYKQNKCSLHVLL